VLDDFTSSYGYKFSDAAGKDSSQNQFCAFVNPFIGYQWPMQEEGKL
jgi:hypothetical protein